jgi:hypothetical protein
MCGNCLPFVMCPITRTQPPTPPASCHFCGDSTNGEWNNLCGSTHSLNATTGRQWTVNGFPSLILVINAHQRFPSRIWVSNAHQQFPLSTHATTLTRRKHWATVDGQRFSLSDSGHRCTSTVFPLGFWSSMHINTAAKTVESSSEDSWRLSKISWRWWGTVEGSWILKKTVEDSWKQLKAVEDSWRQLKTVKNRWRQTKTIEDGQKQLKTIKNNWRWSRTVEDYQNSWKQLKTVKNSWRQSKTIEDGQNQLKTVGKQLKTVEDSWGQLKTEGDSHSYSWR